MAIAVGAALLIVVVTLGSFHQLARMPFQSFWILFAALAIQVALEYVHVPKDRVDTVGFGFLMTSYALILGFCFVNLRMRGMAIVAIGIAMNTLVIGLNQGMPTKDPGRVNAQSEVVPAITTEVKHRPEQSDDLLPFLGDIIVLRSIKEVISFGDLVLAVGLCDVVFWGSRKRRRRGEVESDVDIAELELLPAKAVPSELGLLGAAEPAITAAAAAAVAPLDDLRELVALDSTGEIVQSPPPPELVADTTPEPQPASDPEAVAVSPVIDLHPAPSERAAMASALDSTLPPLGQLDLGAYGVPPDTIGAYLSRVDKIRSIDEAAEAELLETTHDDPPVADAAGS